MTEPEKTIPCECVNKAHFDPDARTPNGNPGHQYRAAYIERVVHKAKTVHGEVVLCIWCENDCQKATS